MNRINIDILKSEYIGKIFDSLEVLDVLRDDNNFVVFRCKCTCGNVKDIPYKRVIRGHTKSCGCRSSTAKRLEAYAIAKGYKIKQVVKEFGSGLNDNRKQLSKILKDDKYDKIIVEHKDRLTRFGFNYIQLLTGNRIEVINEAKEEDEDITQDLILIIHCFSARIYGLRKSKRLKLKVK
jgi:predicted site-specific integrase-resolvase